MCSSSVSYILLLREEEDGRWVFLTFDSFVLADCPMQRLRARTSLGDAIIKVNSWSASEMRAGLGELKISPEHHVKASAHAKGTQCRHPLWEYNAVSFGLVTLLLQRNNF